MLNGSTTRHAWWAGGSGRDKFGGCLGKEGTSRPGRSAPQQHQRLLLLLAKR